MSVDNMIHCNALRNVRLQGLLFTNLLHAVL